LFHKVAPYLFAVNKNLKEASRRRGRDPEGISEENAVETQRAFLVTTLR